MTSFLRQTRKFSTFKKVKMNARDSFTFHNDLQLHLVFLTERMSEDKCRKFMMDRLFENEKLHSSLRKTAVEKGKFWLHNEYNVDK